MLFYSISALLAILAFMPHRAITMQKDKKYRFQELHGYIQDLERQNKELKMVVDCMQEVEKQNKELKEAIITNETLMHLSLNAKNTELAQQAVEYEAGLAMLVALKDAELEEMQLKLENKDTEYEIALARMMSLKDDEIGKIRIELAKKNAECEMTLAKMVSLKDIELDKMQVRLVEQEKSICLLQEKINLCKLFLATVDKSRQELKKDVHAANIKNWHLLQEIASQNRLISQGVIQYHQLVQKNHKVHVENKQLYKTFAHHKTKKRKQRVIFMLLQKKHNRFLDAQPKAFDVESYNAQDAIAQQKTQPRTCCVVSPD